jgi:hypothetical protein
VLGISGALVAVGLAAGLVVELGVDADENGRVNVPVVAFPVPVDPAHASSSASSWSSASSRASSSKSSCFSARSSADSSASRVASTWSSVASRSLGLLDRVLRALHRRAVDQPVEHRPLRVELRLLLLERPARGPVVEGREHLAGGDPVADLDLDGREPAAGAEAEVLLARRRQRTGRRHRGVHRGAFHPGGLRLRRSRRARAGGEREGCGEETRTGSATEPAQAGGVGPQRGDRRLRRRRRNRQDQCRPMLAHAALLFHAAPIVRT